MASKLKSPPLGDLRKLSENLNTPLRRRTDLLWKKGSKALLAVPKVHKQLLLFRRKEDIKNCEDLDDNELIKIIHTQNREAYLELFARYHKKLFTYIFHLVGNKDETEDILQNVFKKTFENITHFDMSRKFSSWIYRIAHNEAVNYLKRKSKRHTVSWEDVTTSKDKLEIATNDELMEDKFMREQVVKEVDKAMLKLPGKYQQVLKLRYFQQYSYDVISGILNKPVNTVGTLINRAKRKLLEVVKEENRK